MNKHLGELMAEDGINRSIQKWLYKVRKANYIESEQRGNGGAGDFTHVTYCAAVNAGDTVLSQCVRKTVAREMKIAHWNILSAAAPVTEDTLHRINESMGLWIGGGGYFLPDTNENAISGWQWAIPSEMLARIQVPVYVFSVGYNYFPGQEPNQLFRDSLNALAEKSSFFGLRNMGSVKAVRNMLDSDALRNKVQYQPCTTTLIRKLYEHLPEKRDHQSVAVNMAFDRENLRFGEHEERILKEVAKAVAGIEKKGYDIHYVCHCWNDDKFLPYLKDAKVKYKLVDLSRQYPDAVIRFYQDMDVVIGMRGHAQMIPFGLNCEMISLGTHDKVKWFLEDIGAEDWYVDIAKDCHSIESRILEVFERMHEKERDETRIRLKDAQEHLWNVTLENLKSIHSSLGGSL